MNGTSDGSGAPPHQQPEPNAAHLRSVAEDLARTAGLLAAEGRRSVSGPLTDPDRVETKSSPTDLVTVYDRAAEHTIVDWLQTNRPDDAIVGEEGSSVEGASGLEWHIDPIDGTTNFVYDQPAWACSVGVRDQGRILAGAVYAPALDEMYSAAAEGGATLNGAPISVSAATDLSTSLIATGFSFDAVRRNVQGRAVANLLGSVRDIRRLGSAALDLCFVACGRADAYFEVGVNSWDILAGTLIALEAGAVATSFGGEPMTPDEVLVSTPGIHQDLVAALGSALAG